MNKTSNAAWTWLMAAVLLHLAVSIVHGGAHTGARVPLSPAANAFVYIVILAGPLVGLGLTWWNGRLGGWVIGLTMAASFVFGVVNHFVLSSPDHVTEVDPQWRTQFTVTAVLIAVIEAIAVVLAAKYLASERLHTNSPR